jgi:hypothetical protein
MTTSLAPLFPVRRVWLARPVVAVIVLGMIAAMLVTTASRADASPKFDDVIDITFPVNDYHRTATTTSTSRGNGERTHLATDIMTVYGEPVYAAMGGTIRTITGLDGNPPGWGYAIYIDGDDGRMYVYIHLGSQTGPPSEAYAPGMRRGLRVERGQHIGFSGHSGNASEAWPHLHFEIHDPNVESPHATRPGDRESDKHRMNPFPSLKAAEARGDTPESRRTPSCSGRAFAFAGDWDRSGRDGLGWWCDGRVRLRTAGGDLITYNYGRSGDIPVVADWNGNGQDTISIVRDGTWHINERLSGGASARSFTYGRVTRGDVPVAGDWNGSGQAGVGIIRGGEWHLRNDQRGGVGQHVFTYGRITRGDLALIGDWSGNGRETIGIVREREWHLRNQLAGGTADHAFIYGRVLRGDTPVMGDWNGNGIATPGIVRDGEWHLSSSPPPEVLSQRS